MTPPKEIIRLGQIEIRFLLDGDDTGGRLSVFEFLVPPGARVPAPHYHEQVDEVAYGLEGVLTFTVDGRSEQIAPGDRCFIPRGAVHQFVNAGAEPTRTLSLLTPGLIGPAYFRDMAALLAAGGPPDPARVAEVMRRHGLIVVPARRGKNRTRWETSAEWRARLGDERWAELQQWQADHRWHPHQLRHNAGTRLRKQYGLEAARIVLGQRSAAVAEIYAEVDHARAEQIMGEVG